jgi:ribosomal protein S18 acetylase RimI-like enzyme
MIDVKAAGVNDASLISALAAKSFFEAFGHLINTDDINLYIAQKFNAEQIRSELDDTCTRFFIAYCDEKPAGYAKLISSSPKPEQISELNAIELQRIYVLEKYYDMKVGRQLMLQALNCAYEKGYDAMWLGVWKKNYRAIDFYKNGGFEIFGQRTFTLGSTVNDDYLMVKKF